ncbi:MAG TPA: type II toxin-antitoxin system RelE/ParE family toxin [Hanamia sp.]
MAYTTSFRKRAAKEYLNALKWYKERSLQAAKNFVLAVSETLNKIEEQPDRFRIIHKSYHEVKIKKYPFRIVYFIDEKNKIIVVATLFHQKRNPERKFK